MTDFLDLARRLQMADTPTYRDECDIAAAIGFDLQPEFGGAIHRAPPHYLTSLDAAIEAIPEGWRLGNLAEKDPQDGKATCHLVRIGSGYGPKPEDRAWSGGKTMAQAITAAAMLARHADANP